MLKTWGIGDLIEANGIPFADTDYNTIESISGTDKVNQATQNRVIGNLFDNQKAIKDFLETFSEEKFSGNRIFQTGHTHAFEPTAGDAIAINLGKLPGISNIDFTVSGWTNPAAGNYFTVNTILQSSPTVIVTNYVFWYEVSGVGIAPVLGAGHTYVKVAILSGDTVLQVATKTRDAILSTSSFYVSLSQDDPLTKYSILMEGAFKGAVSDITSSGLPAQMVFTQVQSGVDYYWQSYIRIKPGVAFIDGNIVSYYPDTKIAERQLAKALGLNTVESEESISITYDEANDLYDCEIKKYDNNAVLQTYTYSDKASGVELVNSIFTNFYDEILYATQFGDDYSTVDFSSIVLEYSKKITIDMAASTFYSGIKMVDGKPEILIQDTEFGATDIKIAEMTVMNIEGTSFNISGITDYRTFYSFGFSNFDEFIFLNADEADTSAVTNPFSDASIDYSTLTNKNTHIVVLNGVGGNNNNAVFSYIKPDSFINEIDVNVGALNPASAGSDVFYSNKDIIINMGDADDPLNPDNPLNSLFSLRQLKEAEFGIKTVEHFADLTPTGEFDGEVYLAKDTNSFYRWNAASDTWIPVSDPHRQVYGFSFKKLGSEGTGIDNKIFTFGDVNFKVDGTNANVFKNGLFQIFNEDYTITNTTTIEFVAAISPTDVIAVQIIRGGEEYYPDYKVYTAGTAEAPYTGGLREFETGLGFQLLIDNNRVYRNGVLQTEGEEILNSTATGGATDYLEDTAATFNTTVTLGDFVIFTNPTSVLFGETAVIQYISSNTVIYMEILSGDLLPVAVSAIDTYQILRARDYVINEYNETVIFSEPVTAGDYIRIEERAAIISSFASEHKGSAFPIYQTLGMDFYHTGYDSWFKWNGNSWVSLG